jgi:TRAP-type C4-dicarboxylate transport system permease small subunit
MTAPGGGQAAPGEGHAAPGEGQAAPGGAQVVPGEGQAAAARGTAAPGPAAPAAGGQPTAGQPTGGQPTGGQPTGGNQPGAEPVTVIDTGVGANPVAAPAVTLIALTIIAVLVFAVYCLIAIWPASQVAKTVTTSHIAGMTLQLSQDQRLFLVVAITGALGGLIHSGRSLYEYAGNRILLRSWLWMYLSLPFIGGALAVLFYVILRGGLITGAAAEVNFYGFAAISALVGLFSPEAAEKLKQIFSTLLAPAPQGRDSLIPGTKAVADGMEPRSGPPGTTIKITGHYLSGTRAVMFRSARVVPDEVSEAEVLCTVPQGATTGRVCLLVGDHIVEVPGEFHVTG